MRVGILFTPRMERIVLGHVEVGPHTHRCVKEGLRVGIHCEWEHCEWEKADGKSVISRSRKQLWIHQDWE
jgi:hypothetical protein